MSRPPNSVGGRNWVAKGTPRWSRNDRTTEVGPWLRRLTSPQRVARHRFAFRSLVAIRLCRNPCRPLLRMTIATAVVMALLSCSSPAPVDPAGPSTTRLTASGSALNTSAVNAYGSVYQLAALKSGQGDESQVVSGANRANRASRRSSCLLIRRSRYSAIRFQSRTISPETRRRLDRPFRCSAAGPAGYCDATARICRSSWSRRLELRNGSDTQADLRGTELFRWTNSEPARHHRLQERPAFGR